MSKLFTPVKVGRTELPHRIAMAPMTRFRNSDLHVPLPVVKEYYEQRAAVPGTLLVTEATHVSLQGSGYENTPAIYTGDQIAGWRAVTDAVHAQGSYIYSQLWSLGRVADKNVLAEVGYDVVSSSAKAAGDGYPIPRPLTEDEIRLHIAEFVQAAKNAIAAGFDGVEIHGANGYLIDQFIQDISNSRTDQWGGSVENRARFALELTTAVADAIGAERTAIRLSPWSTFQGMRMSDPVPQFTYLAKELAKIGLSYVHLVESRVSGDSDGTSESDHLDFFLEAYGRASPVVIAGGYTPALARMAVDSKYRDWDIIIAFGRPFTSNPDLVFRVKENLPLRPYERATFYTPKEAKGYSDYDFSGEFKAALAAA